MKEFQRHHCSITTFMPEVIGSIDRHTTELAPLFHQIRQPYFLDQRWTIRSRARTSSSIRQVLGGTISATSYTSLLAFPLALQPRIFKQFSSGRSVFWHPFQHLLHEINKDAFVFATQRGQAALKGGSVHVLVCGLQ